MLFWSKSRNRNSSEWEGEQKLQGSNGRFLTAWKWASTHAMTTVSQYVKADRKQQNWHERFENGTWGISKSREENSFIIKKFY